jgi:predicted ATPase
VKTSRRGLSCHRSSRDGRSAVRSSSVGAFSRSARDAIRGVWEDERVMFGSAHGEAAPLLGRLEEQSLLTSLLDDVAARGGALVLRGEPGIGKSRLLSMCERTARERGMAVLSTTGVQSEAHLPFAGLHQLLRPVRDRASELRDVQRAALDSAFGLTHEAAPEHFRIAMAVLDLFSDVATAAPLLVIVEDAHWLDRPTADVLAFVARRIESDSDSCAGRHP